jgi:hypothetical protein
VSGVGGGRRKKKEKREEEREALIYLEGSLHSQQMNDEGGCWLRDRIQGKIQDAFGMDHGWAIVGQEPHHALLLPWFGFSSSMSSCLAREA